MEEKIGFSIRGAAGITVFKGVTNPQVVYNHVVDDPSNDVRVMQYSNSGKYICFCDSIDTYLIDTETGEELIKHPLEKPTLVVFSPKDTFFVTWEMYCIYGRRTRADGTVKTPNPNINYFSVGEKKHLKVVIGKRKEDVPQWTSDEKYMVQIVGSEILAFEDGNIEKSKYKTVVSDIHAIAVSPHQREHLFAAFIPSKNEPSKVQLHRINKDMTVLSTIIFTNCDKLDMKWNSKGTAMLALASVDVDKSGKSYYGNSYLQVLSFNGEKCRIPFDKEGSVHDVKWSPTGSHFAACYGYMPAKISVYNAQGNAIWNLGECHRNEVHFNTQGNLFTTCGFGSLTGKIQVWNFDEQKEINTIEVPNTTQLEFSSDGQHFFTATTAPRMRVDNCYRLWKYTGEMLFEYAPTVKYELWQVKWKPMPEAVNFKFNTPPLSKEDKARTGLRMKVANGAVEVEVHANAIKKVGAYVPPHLRGGSTQGALQQSSAASIAVSNDNEKKIKKLEGNLRDIQKLKEKQERGETLQANQLEKLGREAAVLADLEKLKVAA
uniref:Eukaryotic translation initiation factor 2A n=1 Tax=Panagrolaimus superbus TaxID=310955 RepID=A0A914YXV4_9BILA